MAKKRYLVNLTYTVGYTTTVEAETESEAFELAKTEAETNAFANDDCDGVSYIDYAECDDSCSQVTELEDD